MRRKVKKAKIMQCDISGEAAGVIWNTRLLLRVKELKIQSLLKLPKWMLSKGRDHCCDRWQSGTGHDTLFVPRLF